MTLDALQRTLDAIDAVTTCGWCGAALTAASPSPNYCSEAHQDLWLARNARKDMPPSSHPEPLAEDALAALAAAGCISDELLEAYRLWHDREPLDEPMPLSALFDEFLRFQPPRLFFELPPAQEEQQRRLIRELSLGARMMLPPRDLSGVFRNITVA